MENFEGLADFISLVDFSPFFLDEHWHSNTLLSLKILLERKIGKCVTYNTNIVTFITFIV